MSDSDPDTIVTAVASGDTDRVNRVIDAIEDREPACRAALFDQCVDHLVDVYREADDGYTRQSVVRTLDALYSVAAVEEGNRRDFDPDGERSTRFVEFLLEALCDDDGRVRQSAVGAIGPLCIGCVLRDDEAILEAFAERLDALNAEFVDENVRADIEKARDEVVRYLGPIGAGIKGSVNKVRDELDEE